VLEALRILRLELDSILEALHQLPGVMVTSGQITQRVEEFYLSWSNLRSQLAKAKVSEKLISRADQLGSRLVRLTARRSRKQEYRSILLGMRRVLVNQLLLEVASVDLPAERKVVSQLAPSLLPEIPGLTTDLIPTALYGSTDSMRKFLRQSSYDHNVFLMVAYRANLKPLIADVKSILKTLGLHAVLAKDHDLTDDLYNPLACLLCCQYGIAIFDRGDKKQTHNPNVVYELAMMQTLKRRCMILKHKAVKEMPADFLHKLYQPYKTRNEATKAINEWWKRVLENQD
jgi:hypothetical protein